MKLKAGDDNAKMQVQGKSVFLHPPTLPLSPPVTVQIKNRDSLLCWEATYGAGLFNTTVRYKADSN